MKLYLAGPMRGHEDFNRPAFDYAAHWLRYVGHEVMSPSEESVKLFGAAVRKNAGGDEGKLGGDAMTISRVVFSLDAQWICLHADGVALLAGWLESRGALAEHAIANALPIPSRPWKEFLREPYTYKTLPDRWEDLYVPDLRRDV
jgi:hypothetical protein